jgi:hypothetical protein
MPACGYPRLPDHNRNQGVELQGDYCCSTAGGSSFNPGAVFAPREMLSPFLSSGVEERHDFPSQWIDAVGLVAFGAVAQATRQPKILLSVGSTSGAGDQMIDLQPAEHIALMALAIAAALACLLLYA